MTSPRAGDRADRLMGWAALAGYALLFLAVPLRPPLMLFDLLAPLMAWQAWRKRREWTAALSPSHPLAWLILASGWVLLSSAIQYFRGGAPLYNTAVFLYLPLAALFYYVTPPPSRRACAWAGALLLGFCLLALLLGRHCGEAVAGRLFYTEEHLVSADGGALARRFQFLFTNPNLLGSAFALPLLLLLPTLRRRLAAQEHGLRNAALTALLLFIACLPLLSSASKHLLLSFGLCCGLLATAPALRRFGRWAAPALTAAAGLLFALTVWFRTYPALHEPPWIDFQGRSNYSTHQEVYLDIIAKGGPPAWAWGYAGDELRRLYPRHADAAKIGAILEPYYGHRLDGTFATFMDPHNEYLNTASLFGLPALLLYLLAGLCLCRNALRDGNTPALCLLVALAFCCLWDDLASKRWIWLYLGLLMRRPPADGLPAAPQIGAAGR